MQYILSVRGEDFFCNFLYDIALRCKKIKEEFDNGSICSNSGITAC